MATANATAEKMTLDRSDGSVTIALYRAALGPVHTDYYLKAFTRFDASGKAVPLWNWTAALLSLNWLLFRQLWVAALAYTGALVATALLLLGIARLVFQVSDTTLWLLAGVALLLAMGLPGALGNAWLYAACNKKMERALVASATLEEACTALAAKAAGRKHLAGLLAGNLALGAVLAATVFLWPDNKAQPLDPGPLARSVPVESLHSGLAAQSIGMLGAAPASAVAAASAPAVALAAPTPAGASRVSQGVVQMASAPIAAPTPVPKVAEAIPQPAAEAPVVAPVEKKHLSAREAKAEKAAKLAEKKLLAKKERAAKAKSAEATAKEKAAAEKPAHAASAAKPEHAASAPANAPADEKFLINVGLFADANNARNALAKLQDAGLPAQSQEIKSAKGTRTRVRVGPFETLAEADRVAEKIRSLQLEALVFKP